MKHLIQKVLIFIFNFFAKFSKNKNILFSKFMSNHDIDYILKNSKIGNCLYVLNVHDIGVSRRIYIGMDDEHLKTIKDNKGKTYLIAAINNERPKLFLINE